MSNFETFAQILGGIPGTAVQHYSASTVDSLATITTAGYLNDLGDKVKLNDIFWINYLDTSTQPVGGSVVGMIATLGVFQVTVSGSNVSLTAFPIGAPAVANLLSAGFANPNTNANLVTFDVTVGQAALASAGTVTLYASTAAKQFKVRMLELESGGTNFSGGGGDRLGQVTDGTSVYSVIPAAVMQSLVNARWGVSTPLPNAASVANNTSTVAGASLVFSYSGGTTDYTAGSLRISGMLERVA